MRTAPNGARRRWRAVVLLTATVLAAASRGETQLAPAAGTIDCASARAAGEAPAGCYALRESSPYRHGAEDGRALGADAASLAGLERCVRTGAWDAEGCRADVETQPPVVVCPVE